MTAKLIVTAGTNRGAQFPLTDRIIFNIGSDRGSTVFLEDQKVSPNHCRLYKEDSKFTLFDVSGKGLSVNGKKVVKAVLAEGDVVQIGDTEIRFTTSDASYAAPQAAAPALGAGEQASAPAAAASAGGSAGAPAPAARWEGKSVGGAPGEPRGYTRVWLQCVEGNDKGKTFDLSEGTVWVIGRGHSADVTVMDIKVSRAHSRIDRQGNTFYLNDLNSTNGTFLNGQQIDRQVLHRGDYVKVGYTILSFQYDEVPEPIAAPPPPMQFAPPPPPHMQQHAPPPPMPMPIPMPMPQAQQWAPPPAAPAPAPGAWAPPPAPAAPPGWGPPGGAAPQPMAPAGAAWAPPPVPGAAPAPFGAAEDDYRARGVLNYDEVEGAPRGAPPAHAPKAAQAAPPMAAPPGGGDEDAPLDMSALDDDAGAAAPGHAPPAFAPAGAWAPPPMPGAPAPGGWGPPPGGPGALPAPAPGAWGMPQGGPGMLPPPPQRAPAWGDPGAAAWAPPGGAPGFAPGGALPPPPQRQQLKTSDMMVPNLDDDADLFPGGAKGAAVAAPAWGAPPQPAPGGWGAPPPAAPGAWAPPPIPGAPPGADRPRHKTGELPVSDYLVRGGPAPPPISSEQNAPLACFLCNKPFSQDDIRQNRLRRIQDHYYCLQCVQE